jgi:hypothetical protein
MRNYSRKHQQGMALFAMVLMFLALLAIIGGIVAASRANTSTTADQSNKLVGTAVIDQANNISLGASIMMSKGRSMVEISDTSTDDGAIVPGVYGLYHPLVGGTQVQAPTPDASNSVQKWVLKIDLAQLSDATRPTMTASGVGTPAADYAVVFGDIKLTVCQQINVITHGKLLVDLPEAVASGALSDFTSPLGLIVTDPVKHAGWQNGCVKTSDGKYAYFNVIKPL